MQWHLTIVAIILALTVTVATASNFNTLAPVAVEPHECVLTTWNAIILHNFTSQNTDIEGRIAVGHTGLFGAPDGSYTVTMKYPVITNGERNDVLVNLGYWGNGGGMIMGGGNAVYTDIHSSFDRATMVHAGDKIRRDTEPWFAYARTTAIGASARLRALSATGTTTIYYNTVTFTGTNSHINVFKYSGSHFAAATSMQLSAVPEGATVIINVDGHNISTNSFGMQWDVSKYNVVFNLYEATVIHNTLSWEGTVLAPYATMYLGWNRIQGGVFVNNYFGPTQINWFPYKGALPLCTPFVTDCVHNVDYWKVYNSEASNTSHRIAWPIKEDTTFCTKTWLDIVKTHVHEVSWMGLAQQYIAARLNIQHGATATWDVQATMADAITWINKCDMHPSGTNKAIAASYQETLARYNTAQCHTPACPKAH